MPTLDVKAFMYVVPVKATVTVVDSAFHAKGDVNWDGFIDGTDLDTLVINFGKGVELAPDCDLNGDGRIDFLDLALCNRNQGEVAPELVTPLTTEVAVGKSVVQARYGRRKLKVTAYMAEENRKRVIFIFSPLGLLGRGIVR